MVTRVFLFWTVIGLLACGGAKEPKRPSLEAHQRWDLTRTGQDIRLQFTRPLKGINSREHYLLEVELLSEESEVTLHSHFNGFAHRDGAQISFRLGSDRSLVLQIASPGLPPRRAESLGLTVPEDGRLRLRVEVHDGGPTGVRALIWNEAVTYRGEVEAPRARLTAKNAEFDSATVNWIFLTNGRGVFWGIETKQARIHAARREAPYVE